MNDGYAECIRLEGFTSDELAKSFADKLTEAIQRNEPTYSPRWEAMLEWCLASYMEIEFKGEHFIVLEWKTVHYKDRDEFLGTED